MAVPMSFGTKRPLSTEREAGSDRPSIESQFEFSLEGSVKRPCQSPEPMTEMSFNYEANRHNSWQIDTEPGATLRLAAVGRARSGLGSSSRVACLLQNQVPKTCHGGIKQWHDGEPRANSR